MPSYGYVQKQERNQGFPLHTFFFSSAMDSLPQKFSTNFSVISSAGTGYPVQLQKNLWKRERDSTMALDKCLLSEWILTEMSNPPVGSNITFRNKQKAYPCLGKPCKKKWVEKEVREGFNFIFCSWCSSSDTVSVMQWVTMLRLWGIHQCP